MVHSNGIKAVYLDLDGVSTLDTQGSETTFGFIHKNLGLQERGISFKEFYKGYSDDDGKARFMHPLERGEVNHEDIWEAFCDKVKIKIPIEMLYSAFRSTEMNLEVLYVAQKIAYTGKYFVGMITDNPHDRMEAIIAKYSLDSLFNPIVVSSDSDVRTLKKDPKTRNFVVASSRSGISLEDSIFIDNSGGNVEAAKKQGIHAEIFDDSVLRDDARRRKEVVRIEYLLKNNYGLNF